MMYVFDVVEGIDHTQKHCVVARSMGEAERLWTEMYKSRPKSITRHSDYCIVAPEPKEEP